MRPDPSGGPEPARTFKPWSAPADADLSQFNRRRTIRRVLVAALVIPAVVSGIVYGYYGLVGWGPVPAAEYVGKWQLKGTGGRVATLTLNADGSLAAKNVPNEIFSLGEYTEPDWTNTVDVTGEWELDEPEMIWVRVHGIASTVMWIQGRDWGMTLNIRAGDPDRSPIFAFGRA